MPVTHCHVIDASHNKPHKHVLSVPQLLMPLLNLLSIATGWSALCWYALRFIGSAEEICVALQFIRNYHGLLGFATIKKTTSLTIIRE